MFGAAPETLAPLTLLLARPKGGACDPGTFSVLYYLWFWEVLLSRTGLCLGNVLVRFSMPGKDVCGFLHRQRAGKENQKNY